MNTTSHDLLANKKILGIDVDGVIARFAPSYMRLLHRVSGRYTVNPETFEQQEWHWEKALGFTSNDVAAAWNYIKVDPMFWRELDPVAGIERFLEALKRSGHDIYFVTARPGLTAKRQTESWLRPFFDGPTVLITANKAGAAQTLGFDAYIDDNRPNCEAVAATGVRVYMPRTGYNRVSDNTLPIVEIDSIFEMLEAEAIPYEGPRSIAQAA